MIGGCRQTRRAVSRGIRKSAKAVRQEMKLTRTEWPKPTDDISLSRPEMHSTTTTRAACITPAQMSVALRTLEEMRGSIAAIRQDAPKAGVAAADAAVTRVGEWPKPITPFSANDATDAHPPQLSGRKEREERKKGRINMQIAIYSFVTVLPSSVRPWTSRQLKRRRTDDDEEEFMKRTEGRTEGRSARWTLATSRGRRRPRPPPPVLPSRARAQRQTDGRTDGRTEGE